MAWLQNAEQQQRSHAKALEWSTCTYDSGLSGGAVGAVGAGAPPAPGTTKPDGGPGSCCPAPAEHMETGVELARRRPAWLVTNFSSGRIRLQALQL